MDSPNNSPHQYELDQLVNVLAALDALELLPSAENPSSRAMPHDEWMKRHKEINDLYRDAQEYALLALPSEVKDALNKVKRRKNALLNIEDWEVTWKRIQEEKAKKEGDTPQK